MSSYRKNLITKTTASAAAAIALMAMVPNQASAQMGDKWVTVVLSEEPEGLDICNQNRSTVGRIVRTNVGEALTQINPIDGAIEPRLATSWEKLNDTTWRFKLREGVKFHDGTPFNAESASLAIARTMDTGDKSSRGTGIGGLDCETRTKSFGDLYIKGVPVDEYTLDIVASKPAPILPTRMGVVGLASPKSPMDSLTLEPIGTGPYKFEKWTAGQEITIVRNEDYWGDKPVVEGARFIFRGESAVRAAMVEVGEADIAANIAVQDATNPDTDFSYLNSETTRLRIDTEIPPLNDKRVRMALNYAIDREALRGSVLSKDILHATQIVVPSIIGHNHEIDKKVRPYDPEMAMKLIAEAKADGVAVDTELELVGRINIYPNATETMEAMMAMLQAVGFNVKLRMLEVAEWLDVLTKPYAQDRGPILLQAQHDNNNGDPVFSVFNKFACGGAQSTLCEPELDKMINEASILSNEARVNAWKEVFRHIYEDSVSDVWMYHMVGYSRVNPRLNYTPTIATNSEVTLETITFK